MRKLTLRPTRSWGVYREDHLETAFLLGRDGIASGEDGQPVDLLADAQIGLAATTELEKKQLALWDGEDEAVSGGIEVRISVCVWITSLFTVLAFFLLAALFSGLAASAGAPPKIPAPLFFGALAAFLAALFASIVLQQKLVDLAKQLNPEKEGSVYDTRFQKKWFESCDEAERAIIGQCAFKAYQAMCRMCLVLWAVFALGGIFFSWGFLPAMAVCVVWAAGQSVYARWTLKLGRPAGKV